MDTRRLTDKQQKRYGNGSCVAAKICGWTFGVAKKSTIIVMEDYESTNAGLLHMLREIYVDIRLRRQSSLPIAVAGKTMISLPYAYAMRAENYDLDRKINVETRKIMNQGVVFVTSAGNGGQSVNTFPAIFAGGDLPMIVVGSVTMEGTRSSFSSYGDKVTVSAVGEPGVCAWPGSPNKCPEQMSRRSMEHLR